MRIFTLAKAGIELTAVDVALLVDACLESPDIDKRIIKPSAKTLPHYSVVAVQKAFTQWIMRNPDMMDREYVISLLDRLTDSIKLAKRSATVLAFS